MPNPPIARIDFSTGAAVLYTADPKIRYTFPIVGKDQVPVPPAVIVDNSARIDTILASLQTITQGFADLKASIANIARVPADAGTPPASSGPALPTGTSATPGWTALTLSVTDNIRAALAIAGKGFKLKLLPGRYKQCLVVPRGLDGWEIASSTDKASDVVLDGQGGLTVAQNNTGVGATRLAYGKGVLLALCPGTVRDLEITGGGTNATDGHDGQAGLYWDTSDATGQDLKAVRVMFRRNQNGCFGNGNNKSANYVFDHCDFIENSVDGGSHDTYLNGVATSATFIECYAPGSRAGNNFKTRIETVTILGGWHGSQNGNRWVELADGGTLTISGGIFVGNDIGQNVFGNGTESTKVGPGDTAWTNSDIYLGNRPADFANARNFNASDVRVHANPGGGSSFFNSKNMPLNGLAVMDTAAAPAAPASFRSGAQ